MCGLTRVGTVRYDSLRREYLLIEFYIYAAFGVKAQLDLAGLSFSLYLRVPLLLYLKISSSGS